MQDELQPKEQAGDFVAGFSLTPIQRYLSLALGIAIVGYSAYALFTERAVGAVIVFLLLGAGCFAAAAIGRIGRVTVEGAGAKLSIEPSEATFQSQSAHTSASPTTSVASQEQDEVGEVLEQVEAVTKGDTGSDSPIGQAINAYVDKNYEVFEEKMDEAIGVEEDGRKKHALQSSKLLYLFRAGKGDRLRELEKLREEQPDVPIVTMRLGDAYESTGDNVRAAAIYAEGQAIESIEEGELVTLLGRQSEVLRKAKLFDDAIAALQGGLGKVLENNNIAGLHKYIADFYEDVGNSVAREWHLEKVLEVAPGENGARFELAYSYSESGFPLASFHHYDILVRQRRHAAELNNQALLLSELDMPILAAKCHKEAQERGSTLSAANLAATMRDAGLVEEAQAVLDEALKADDVDSMVYRVASSLSQNETDEDKRFKAVRDNAGLERNFVRKLFDVDDAAANEITTSDVEGLWNTTIGEVKGEVTIKEYDGRLQASFRREPFWDWTLEGEVSGRVYKFNWMCDRPSQNQSGDGLILFGSDKTFEGLIRDSPSKGDLELFSGTKKA